MRTSCFCQTNVWIEHFEVRMRSWCNFTSIINRQNLKYNAGCSQKSEGGKKNMTKQNSFFLVVHFQTCPVSCWFSVPQSKSETVWLKLTGESFASSLHVLFTASFSPGTNWKTVIYYSATSNQQKWQLQLPGLCVYVHSKVNNITW